MPIGAGSTSPVDARQVQPLHAIFSVMDIFALLLSISILIIGLVLLWFYGLRRIQNARHRLKSDARKAHTVFQKAYGTLGEAVREHVQLLAKKHKKTSYDLETESSLHQLQEQLDKTEATIQKDLQKIEKELT